MKQFISLSEQDTLKIASDFAKTLKIGDVIALHGTLGVGKTAFTRGVIQSLTNAPEVPSPTFTIVQSYDGITHFDLYRVEDADELVEVGLEYAMQNDITLIEWPEIAEPMMPKDTIHVYISAYGDGRRVQVMNIC